MNEQNTNHESGNDRNSVARPENKTYTVCGQGVCVELFRSRDWSKHPLQEKHLSSKALQFSLEIVFNSKHPMFIWWGEQLYQFYNDAYISSLGMGKHPATFGEQAKEHWTDIWPIIDPQINIVMQSASSTWNEEHLLPVMRNGKIENIYLTYSCSPIYDNGAVGGVLVVFSEVTKQVAERKTLQKKVDEMNALQESLRLEKVSLEQDKIKAQEANEAKTSFLASMSHEIRTPLNAILGFADILNSADGEIEKYSHYLEIITRNGQALGKIINDILDLSKIEAGKIEIEYLPISLTKLIREIVSMFIDRASRKGLILTCDTSGLPDCNIVSDAARIRQVLVNLIGNAIKFTEVGGVNLRCGFDPIGPAFLNITFLVEDTGPGLSKEDASKLFKTYAQGNTTQAHKLEGTGLGLVLSRKLAKALGGDVTLQEAVPGKGCKFKFSLVALKTDDPEATLKKYKIEKKTGRLVGKEILVVDDSPDNREFLEVVLENEHARLDFAENGNEALAKALAGTHDLILLDIEMPGLNGYEVLEALKNSQYAKPVIALTAHAMHEEKRKVKAAGFIDHVTKPIDCEVLIATIIERTKKP